MKVHKKYLELMKNLESSTANRKIEWMTLESVQDAYIVKLGNGAVSISRKLNDLASDSSHIIYDYYIKILDKNYNTVESFSDMELAREVEDNEQILPNGAVYSNMKSLFDDVRRSVKGADSLLDSIISELES